MDKERLNNRIYRLAYSSQQYVVNNGHLAVTYMNSRPAYQEIRPTLKTSLVVDGFPRSANSYCYYALMHALRSVGEVRGHTHGAGIYGYTRRKSIPAVALIRKPEDAVSSFLQYNPRLTPDSALRSYILFNETVLKFSSSIMVVSFETATQDFAAVLDSIASTFPSLASAQTTWTESDERTAREAVASSHFERHGGKLSVSKIPLPQSTRGAMRDELLSRVVASTSYSLATDIYQALREISK